MPYNYNSLTLKSIIFNCHLLSKKIFFAFIFYIIKKCDKYFLRFDIKFFITTIYPLKYLNSICA